MRKKGNHIIRLFMLASGIILLLTVVIPHHHHENGLPCIHLFEHDNNDTDGGSHHPSCDCAGHDLAFNSKILHSSDDNEISLPLLPLFSILEYAKLPEPLTSSIAFYSEKAIYIETLHSIWIAKATGLRAPPF